MTADSVQYILKQIMMAVSSAARKDYHVKLNVGIGFIKIRSKCLSFENLASSEEIDKLTQSSCNTNFRANKFNMTHFGAEGESSHHS